MRFTTALFDFGGVVVDAPFDAFAQAERDRGLDPGTLRRINATNPDDNAWARLERGEIDAAEFAHRFTSEAAAFGVRLEGRIMLDILTGLSVARESARVDVMEAIAELRAQGVRVGLVTNNIAPLSSQPAATWVFDEFDAVVESSVLGVRKPMPEIYLAACRALGCVPGSAVFVDDLGINLKPARALGMRTIKVVDHAAALCELRDCFAVNRC